MAAARALGQRVVCASATAGEHGTDDPLGWPPGRLGAVRRWEAAAAMAVLGVHEYAILGLPDGGLSDHADEGLAWVRRLIRFGRASCREIESPKEYISVVSASLKKKL